jgi:hypothetical protein
MPPVAKKVRPTATNRSGRRGNVDSALVDAAEVASIRGSVAGKEQAPSSRQSVGSKVDWQAERERLGDPHSADQIPISRLKLMRRDPMLAYGLSFKKVPLARAPWKINAKDNNGPNAQVAANVDWALRRIWTSFVFDWTLCYEFGFSGIAKRYEERIPTGTYIDIGENGEATEQPLWSEGGIKPIVWKPFVSLDPSVIEPRWANDGSFDGITFDATAGGGAPSGVGAKKGSEKEKFDIDVYHSLWATHAKSENFGSIFGWPLIGYAQRYWWSYWNRWNVADRYFEQRADPGVSVRFPDGQDDDGTPFRQLALTMGEQMRAGNTIAIPSETYENDTTGAPSQTRMWDIEYPKVGDVMDPFDKSFDYLNAQKLRAIWVSELSVTEGSGGTSSRNVMSEINSKQTEAEAVSAAQMVDTVNRFIIPQFLATNFPEFLQNGGEAELEMQGFADQDVEARNAIIQLIGQQELGSKELMKSVDLKSLLSDAGIPLRSFRESQAIEEELKAAETAPLPTDPVAGQGGAVGVVAAPGTELGFSYVQPRERIIYLSDRSGDFLESLPKSKHYEDAEVRKQSRKLWKTWNAMYRDQYRDFASKLDSDGKFKIESLKDAKSYVKDWSINEKRVEDTSETSAAVLRSVMKRAAVREAQRTGVEAGITQEELDSYVEDRLEKFMAQVDFTTHTEISNYLWKLVEGGEENPERLADKIRDHFADFPNWKADRLVRSEVRDAYNYTTIALAMNINKKLQGIDGENDPECAERNGKIYTPEEARKEKEHPHGILGFRILANDIEYKVVPQEELPEGVTAHFDDEDVILFSDSLGREERNNFLAVVGQSMEVE